jgi:hypothetical protein
MPELMRLRVINPHIVSNPEQQPTGESASLKIVPKSSCGKFHQNAHRDRYSLAVRFAFGITTSMPTNRERCEEFA